MTAGGSSNPHGGMHVDRGGGDVLMVAGGTGLAPLRTLIMDLTRYGDNPRVHLFFGARYPSELYDLPTLWEIASTNPWLSVTPVSEYNTDPPWAADYPDVEPPRGLHVRQTGTLPDVVTRYGSLGRSADPDLRWPGDGRGHQGGADRKGRTRRAYTTRSNQLTRAISNRGRIVSHGRVGDCHAEGSVVVADGDLRTGGGHDRHLARRRRRRVSRPAPRPGRLRERRQDDGHSDPVSVGEPAERQ